MNITTVIIDTGIVVAVGVVAIIYKLTRPKSSQIIIEQPPIIIETKKSPIKDGEFHTIDLN
jgi:hypothetical protein